MPSRRIIPCLDVKDGRVVKGVQFRDHRDVGDIVDHATQYSRDGADELVFYDISASADRRSLDPEWVSRVARVIDIPFTVAGGLRTRADARACLDAGADKVSINSPALERPDLIDELVRDFGSQCIVLGIDSFEADGSYWVKQYTGSPDATQDTGRKTLDWAREACERGVGEIVLNCMRKDGMRNGYDLAHCKAVVEETSVPVIASGGAGAPEHFRDAFLKADVSGALAATVFHDRLILIPELKEYLASCEIEMRR